MVIAYYNEKRYINYILQICKFNKSDIIYYYKIDYSNYKKKDCLQTDKFSMNALLYCCLNNHLYIIIHLINYCNITKQDILNKLTHNCISMCIKCNNTQILLYLIKKFNITISDIDSTLLRSSLIYYIFKLSKNKSNKYMKLLNIPKIFIVDTIILDIYKSKLNINYKYIKYILNKFNINQKEIKIYIELIINKKHITRKYKLKCCNKILDIILFNNNKYNYYKIFNVIYNI